MVFVDEDPFPIDVKDSDRVFATVLYVLNEVSRDHDPRFNIIEYKEWLCDT